MDKIIIDSSQKIKSGHFALNLSNLENIKDIHLDLAYIKEEFDIYLEKNNFKMSKEYLTLAERLSSYGNEIINNMKLNFYFKYIVFRNKIVNKSVLEVIEVLNSINIFYSICYSSSNFLDFDLDKNINIIKSIENNIDLTKLLEEKYKNDEILSLKEIKEIDKYLSQKSNDKLKEIKDLIVKNINIKIDNIKKLSNEEKVKFICDFLRFEYDAKFFVSREFLHLINNYNEFENYYILSELADKAYLLYKFNHGKDVYSKAIALYSNLIPKYLNLPMYYKEYVVNELLEYKNKYYNVDEFIFNLNDIIDNLNNINKINFIPV